MVAERKTLTQLSVPIGLETLFYMLSGMVDTLMLSSVSDQAVGAVGTANTYIGVFIIMFGVISSGMIAVMSQNIGAGRPGIAYQARQLGLIFNALIGIVMSVVLATFSGGLLRIVSIAPALLEPAEIYLRIVGGTCFLNALIPIFSSYLRVFGYTKHSLIGTVVGNVLNIILNSVFLFAFNWGVMGVAVAIMLALFSFTCLISYYYEAETAAMYLFQGESKAKVRKVVTWIMRIAMPVLIFIWGNLESDIAWNLSDLALGSCTWVNMLIVLLLSPKVIALYKDYEEQMKAKKDPYYNPDKISWSGVDKEMWKDINKKYIENDK